MEESYLGYLAARYMRSVERALEGFIYQLYSPLEIA